MKQSLPDSLGHTTKKNGRNPVRAVLFILIAFIMILFANAVVNKAFNTNLLELANNLFMLKYLPNLNHDVSYGLLFIFGVLTSFHCVGMCGGIAISQTVDKKGSKSAARSALLVPSALYNFGRVAAYTFVGGIAGILGQIIAFSGIWRSIVPIFGGVFMIIMAINLFGFFPVLKHIYIRLPKSLTKKIYASTTDKSRKHYGPFAVGLLTGLMPCGPLQMIQLYALGTGNIIHGAVSMFVFSIGTVPVLFLFGLLNTVINKKHSNVILKFSATLVLVLGVIMIGRGLALAGIDIEMPSIFSAGKIEISENVAVLKDDIQVVDTSLTSDSFPAIVVQKGIRVRWNLHADKENLNDCNRAIVVPQLKIERKLKEGDNFIEFTPTQTGVIPFTCWMGMIKSNITVVEQLPGGNTVDTGDNAGVGSSQETGDVAVDTIPGAAGADENSTFTSGSLTDNTNDSSSNICMSNGTTEGTDPEQEQQVVTSSSALQESTTVITTEQESQAVQEQTTAAQETQVHKETTAASKATDNSTAAVDNGSEPVTKWIENKLTPGGKDNLSANKIESWTGWLIDGDCLGVNPLKHTRDCNLMDTCYASGLGIVIYVPGKAFNSYSSKEDYLVFDFNSRLAARTFIDKLPADWVNNTTIKVSGYIVENIPANADETNVPEPDSTKVDHHRKGIHLTSIETFYIEGVSTNKLPSPNLVLQKQ
jgi:uncharacterized protein